MITCVTNNDNFRISRSVQITVVVIGIVSVILGIWQLYQPLVSHYPSSGWAFIVPGAIGVVGVLTWKSIQFIKQGRKKLPENFKIESTANQGSFALVPKDVLLQIFSYLDLKSLEKLQEASKSLFNLSKEYIRINKTIKLAEQILNKNFLKGIKKTRLQELKGHVDWVNSVFYRDGLLFSGAGDQTVKIWQENPDNGKWACIASAEHGCGSVSSVFYKDHMLFQGSWDKVIMIYQNDSDTWTLKDALKETGSVTSIFYKKETLFCGVGNEVKIWQKDQNQWIFLTALKTEALVITVFFKDNMLFTLTSSGTIEIWQKENDNWISHTIEKHNNVTAIFYKNGFLFSGSKNGTIKVWQKEQENWISKTTLVANGVISSLFFRDYMLFTGDTMGNIKVWLNTQPNEWRYRATLQKHERQISSIFFKDGTLFSGDHNESVMVWKVPK